MKKFDIVEIGLLNPGDRFYFYGETKKEIRQVKEKIYNHAFGLLIAVEYFSVYNKNSGNVESSKKVIYLQSTIHKTV